METVWPDGRRRARLRGGRAGALLSAAALLTVAGCASPPGQPAANPSPRPAGSGTPSPGRFVSSRYISFTSYPGWIQARIPPAKFDFSPWTIINDFGLWPTKRGGIAVGDMQNLSFIPPAVAAAHRARRMIIMAVGEQGLGSAFAAGATRAHRPHLIASIVAYVRKYHFDGVDIDWEEEVPQHRAGYIALVAGVRRALDKSFPRRHMFLSADVNPGQVPPPIAVRIAPYVDTLNVESFQDNGVSSIAAYTRAGIPAGRLLLGIGVAKGYYDTTQARVAAKVKYVEEHGLRGTLLWQPGNLHTYRTDPRLIPLRRMLSLPG